MSSQPQYAIGIDLGTTNCALAYAGVAALDPRELPPVEQFLIPQLIAPSHVREEPLLPSCLYLHGAADFPEGSTALPWDDAPDAVAGALAKSRGAEVPRRLISSAKSWLCHSGVDRTSGLLPATAPEGVAKMSPVEASRRLLDHLKNAWTAQHPDAPFEEQLVLVTVPASFDAVARELTQRAAQDAGYRDVVLLEEPQAAFYAWLERHPDWRSRVGAGDLILVVDIGGGTTDFSLIAVTAEDGQLGLERVAVGEHILLGGDNMDLALAHSVQQELAAKGTRIDAHQLHALWQNCRTAKENLFASNAASHPVTILGKGTGLVGGTIKAKLARETLEQIVLEGFFPVVSSDEAPARQRMSALHEVGLMYAADAAVTRHLAHFLRQAAASGHGSLRRGSSGLAAPTHVLFNGGVFQAGAVRERLLEILNGWLRADGCAEAAALEGEDLMHAVSRGAAYYGLARQGRGVRIRSGISRSYYVGVQPAMPAVPGMRPPMKALTVAQFGMEEGTKATIGGREFTLVVGRSAEFRVFASVERKDDEPGVMIEEIGEELEELAPIEVTLPASGEGTEIVVVTVETEITETGQLQFWCVARDGRRWKLEFNVREQVAGR